MAPVVSVPPMRAALLALLPAVALAAPPPSGDYLDERYMMALARTRSPLAAARAVGDSMPQLLTLRPVGGERRLEAYWDFSRALFLAMLRPDGTLRRELAWGAGPGYAVALTETNRLCLAHIATRHCYTHVGNAQRLILQSTLAGTWRDGAGAVYRIDADGAATFPTAAFRAALLLDRADGDADLMLGPDGALAYRFVGATLRLYGLDAAGRPDLSRAQAALTPSRDAAQLATR